MSDFKILLGMELDKNSLSVITKELQSLSKNVANMKIGIDESAMNKLLKSIDKIGGSLGAVREKGNNAGKDIAKGFKEIPNSLNGGVKACTDLKQRLQQLNQEYKAGAISLADYSKKLESMMFNKNGDISKPFQKLDTTELQEVLKIVQTYKSEMQSVKPIGELINSTSTRAITDGMPNLVRQVDTYKNSLGQTQQIVSLIDNETKELIATTSILSTNDEKRANALASQIKQYDTMASKIKASTHSTPTAISGGLLDAQQANLYNATLDKVNAKMSAIKQTNEQGLMVKKSEITELNRELNVLKAIDIQSKKEIADLQNKDKLYNSLVHKIELANSKNASVANSAKTQNIMKEVNALKDGTLSAEQYAQQVLRATDAVKQFETGMSSASAELVTIQKLQRDLANIPTQAKTNVVDTAQFQEMSNQLTQMEQHLINVGVVGKNEMNKVSEGVQGVAKATREADSELSKSEANSKKVYKNQENMLLKLAQMKQQAEAKGMDVSGVNALETRVKALTGTTDLAGKEFTDLQVAIKQMNGVIRTTNTSVDGMNNGLRSTQTNLKGMLQMATGIYGISSAFMYGRQAISSLISESTALSDAMISLSRVTNETDATYSQFADNAFKIANRIGGSAKELVDSTTEFAKLGFDFQEAGKLAESASKYATTGWLEMGEATDALSASYTVFGGTFDEVIGKVVGATEIIDLYNATGNKMAIDSKGVGEAMKASANSLSSANNSLSESVALIATANKTVQDSSKVGNALRTISMRLRGLNEETGELLPKMQEVVNAGTGGKVNIMNGEEFKSTYDIMLDISKVWDELSDKQRAYLAENVAGKNRAEVFMALMGNAEDLTYAMEVAEGSIGSVDAEMEVVMNTFAKRVEVMKNAWSELATTTVDSGFMKGLVDATTNLIKLMDACGGLVPVLASATAGFVTFKLATATLKADTAITSVLGLVQGMIAYTSATNTATVATQAFNLAKLGLVVGLAAGSVLALGAGMKYLSEETQRAKERLVELQEISATKQDELTNLKSLVAEYDKLTAKTELNTEESQRLLAIQTQIKDIQPEISGHYNEQGQFIISMAEDMQQVIVAQEQIVEQTREMVLAQQKDTMGDTINQYKEAQADIARINELLEIKQNIEADIASGVKFGQGEDYGYGKGLMATSGMLNGVNAELEKLQGGLDETIETSKQSIMEMQTFIADSLYQSDIWDGLGVGIQEGIKRGLSQLEMEEVLDLSDKLYNGTVSAQELADELYVVADAVKEVGNSTNNNLNLEDTILTSLGVIAEQVANDMDILKVALEELNNTNDISEETMKKLISEYPQLANQIKDTTSAYTALNQKITENEFDTATDNMAILVGIQEDLADGNGITADSFKKLSETFPELLAYMNDEAVMADAIKGKMGELETAQATAYRNMLMNSESYYNANIKGNAEMTNSLNSQLAQLFTSYGVMYQDDAKNWSSLAKGKAGTEEDLINKLNQAWGQHFNSLGKAFNSISSKMSPNFSATSYMDKQKNDAFASLGDRGTNMDSVLAKSKAEFSQYQAQISQQQQAMKDLANIFDTIEFKPINIDTGGISVGSGGGSGGSSSSKADTKKASAYIKSLYQSLVDDVLEGSSALQKEIDFTNARLANAMRMGDITKQEEYSSSLEDLFKQQRDEQASMAKELDKYLDEMQTTLNKTGLFKGKDMDNLTQLDLDKIVNNLDKAINSASESEKEALEKQKALVEDVGGVYLDTIEKRMDLSTEWWNLEEQRREQQKENILKDLEEVKRKAEQTTAIIDIKTSVLRDDDIDGQIGFVEDGWKETMDKQVETQKAIDKLKAQGYTNESAEVQTLQDEWLDLEQERLDAIRKRAELRMKAEQEAHDKEVENKQKEIELEKEKIDTLVGNIEDGMDSPQDLLDLTIEMLKKELELEKELLEKAKDDKLEILEEEYEAEKKLYEDKLDLIKKEADTRKKALKDEQDEKGFNDDVADQQSEIAKLQAQITEISLDDSQSAVSKRKQLEEELAKLKKELADTLYDRDIELQEDAIDKELDMQEDKIDDTLDKIEAQYKAEKDLITEKYKRELEELQNQLDREGDLRVQALDLIEGKSQAFYNRLESYATTYTNTTKREFDDLWTSAYSAMDKYGNGVYNVIDALKNMKETVEELRAEMEKLDEVSSSVTNDKDKPSDDYHDYIEDFDKDSDNDDYNFNEDRWDNQQKEPEKPKPSTSNSKPEKTDQEKQQRYLHELMVQAKKENNTGLIKWIKEERKKWGLDPDTGAIKTIRHEGLLMGRIGDNKKASERILKATEDEWVLTGKQYDTLDKNIGAIVGNKATGSSATTPAINVVCDFKGATINKDTLPQLEKMIEKTIPKVLNNTLYKKAIR